MHILEISLVVLSIENNWKETMSQMIQNLLQKLWILTQYNVTITKIGNH